MKKSLLVAGNHLFRHCYPLYRPLYAAYKAISDRNERATLRKLVRPGMRIADVGANIGNYSRFLAGLAGPGGHVVAFEPSPQNFERLRANVADLAWVTPVHAAAGENAGSIGLYVSNDLNVDHHTYDDGDGRMRIEVPQVRLDDYFVEDSRVDLIKLDVQGYEFSVLKGAEQLLVRNRAVVVIMEYWPYGLSRAGVAPADVLAFMTGLGFSVRPTDTHSKTEFKPDALDPRREDHYCNLLLTRSPEAA